MLDGDSGNFVKDLTFIDQSWNSSPIFTLAIVRLPLWPKAGWFAPGGLSRMLGLWELQKRFWQYPQDSDKLLLQILTLQTLEVLVFGKDDSSRRAGQWRSFVSVFSRPMPWLAKEPWVKRHLAVWLYLNIEKLYPTFFFRSIFLLKSRLQVANHTLSCTLASMCAPPSPLDFLQSFFAQRSISWIKGNERGTWHLRKIFMGIQGLVHWRIGYTCDPWDILKHLGSIKLMGDRLVNLPLHKKFWCEASEEGSKSLCQESPFLPHILGFKF